MNAPGAGRPRKPLEIHKLNGNPGKRKENAVEPIPVPRERPEPPGHYDAESNRLWHYFCDAIESMGVLSSIDAPSLEMLVDSWRGYREVQANIRKYGYVHAYDGKMNVSKFFLARRGLFQECMTLLSQFGFNPVARANIAARLHGPEQVDDDDPREAMLRRRMERQIAEGN